MSEEEGVSGTSWHPMGKIYNLGHRAVKDIFTKTVTIEEKIDGSQFSFGRINGALMMKTHHQDVSNQEPFAQFTEVMNYVRELFKAGKLHEGWTYRGEVISKPKHNKLEYQRVPKHCLVGFDIARGEEDYLGYVDKVQEFAKLDLEVVPYYYYGTVSNPETLKTFLDRRPLLGGKFIEGIVVKAYGVFCEDKKTMMAKFVSEAYKEVKPTDENTPGKDYIKAIIESYRSTARWEKAVQSLGEQQKLLGEPKDIGPLVKYLHDDLKAECFDEIGRKLAAKWWGDISRGTVSGFAEWYKMKLMEGVFNEESTATVASPVVVEAPLLVGPTSDPTPESASNAVVADPSGA